MKKTYRIKKVREIDAVFKHKLVKGDAYFAVYQDADSENKHFRFAISIGKKYGKAVERNLAKRRIRMIVSDFKEQIVKDKMFVIVIKPSASTLTFQEMKTHLEALLKKSKIIGEHA